MNLQTIVWAIAALGLGAGGGLVFGYNAGHSAGVTEERGEHDKNRADQLQGFLQKISDQQAQGLEDNRVMRDLLGQLQRRGTVTTKELKDALAKSKPDRVLCRFDADSMRIISAAADAADALAAGGIRRSVPAGNPADGRQR